MRHRRAALVASFRTIVWTGGGILSVESATAGAYYTVDVNEKTRQCACADFKKNRGSMTCKHIKAALSVLEPFDDKTVRSWTPGTVIPRLPPPTGIEPDDDIDALFKDARRRPATVIDFPTGKKESTRRAAAYRSMRTRVPQLVWELSQLFEGPRVRHHGGQWIPAHVRLFSVLFRIFANRSLEDTLSEMTALVRHGDYSFVPPSSKNSLSLFMHDAALKPMLAACLERTARTVRHLEKMVLVDSSGFASIMTQVYLDNGKGQKVIRPVNRWKKAHVACGAATGLIASVIVTDHKKGIDDNDETVRVADVNFWEPLVRSACALWSNIAYAAGDKAYHSETNIAVCDALGIKAVIAIKKNVTRAGQRLASAIELFDFYKNLPELFHEIYRYRVKIEGVFSSMKRTSSGFFRSRGTRVANDKVASENQVTQVSDALEIEMLAKCVIHNLRRIVTLEQLHDERVNFKFDTAFTPLPPEWVRTKDIDEDCFDDADRDESFPLEEPDLTG